MHGKWSKRGKPINPIRSGRWRRKGKRDMKRTNEANYQNR